MAKITKKTVILFFVILSAAAMWLGTNMTVNAADASLKLAWSIKIGKEISSPMEVDNDVVVVSNSERMMAFDIPTGKPLWKHKPEAEIWTHSLASDGERVFFCMNGGTMAALNGADGAVLWKIDLGINCQHPPHVSNGMLYVPTTFVGQGLKGDPLTGAKLYAINPANGQVNWAFTSGNYILQTPYRKGGTVYVSGGYVDPNIEVDEGGLARFYALDSETGQVKWTYESKDGYTKALYATEKRLVFIAYRDHVKALNTANGKLVWTRGTGNWVPSLSGKDGVVFYGSANTKVHAWDALDGKTRWEYNIPSGTFNYMLGAPVFAGNKLYFLSQRGTVFALNRENGKFLWSHPTKIKSHRGLSISGKTLFMGDFSGRLHAYKILK